MSTLVVSNLEYPVEKLVNATVAFDSSYPTGGETLRAIDFGLTRFSRIQARPTGATAGGAGYEFVTTIASDQTTALILAFWSAGATPAGTVAAPTFTGTSPISDLNLATPAFSGTGYATAGQVITTTDNQTMAATDTAAGMWFIANALGSSEPVLILSNTIVAGAPAVLTVQGEAPVTDAGTYKIVKALTPVGTNSAPAFTGTAISAGVFTQVTNTTNLSALTAVPISVWGY